MKCIRMLVAVLAVPLLGMAGSAARAADLDKAAADAVVQRYVAVQNSEGKADEESTKVSQTEVTDLNGDGKEEIVLWTTLFGPTYWNNSVTVFADNGHGYVPEATVSGLGQVQKISIRDGLILVKTQVLGPHDSICCPTVDKVISLRWQGARLVDTHGARDGARPSQGPQGAKAPKSAVPAPENISPPALTQHGVANVWQLRPVAGHAPVATVAGPGVVQSVSLMCDGGTPVIAVAVKARPPAGAVNLGLDFGGAVVNLPLQRATAGATLLLGDLSRSELPRLLASHSSGVARLRINGGLQGNLPLSGARPTSQAALASCYRY